MNKKGNIFFGTMLGLFIFAMGVLFIPFLTDDIDQYRTSLDCSNSTISSGTKLSCIQGSIINPYFIWFFTSIAIGYLIGSRT